MDNGIDRSSTLLKRQVPTPPPSRVTPLLPAARLCCRGLELMMTDCLFCRIAAGAIPSRKLHEDATTFAFHDINPQAPVHVLIIPKKHIASVNEAVGPDEAVLGHMMTVAGRLARDLGVHQAGYRLVINTNEDAGQSVFHIHLHLLGGRGFSWPPG